MMQKKIEKSLIFVGDGLPVASVCSELFDRFAADRVCRINSPTSLSAFMFSFPRDNERALVLCGFTLCGRHLQSYPDLTIRLGGTLFPVGWANSETALNYFSVQLKWPVFPLDSFASLTALVDYYNSVVHEDDLRPGMVELSRKLRELPVVIRRRYEYEFGILAPSSVAKLRARFDFIERVMDELGGPDKFIRDQKRSARISKLSFSENRVSQGVRPWV